MGTSDRRRGQRSREKRGTATGPNLLDRGKNGSKLHILTEAGGLPLAVAVSGANTHDMNAVKPLVRAIPAVRSCRGPRTAQAGQSACRQGLRTPAHMAA
ncbi:transposase [Saccharopolyspora sp. HNM0983]|uniref:Transposase n=1 Tax=Saccharopolyspora montiporae TaxID=2781240 RepID=A0A929B5Y2_9PSEU|nr:transposase [Saccharopolyspora sp. HNM0983]